MDRVDRVDATSGSAAIDTMRALIFLGADAGDQRPEQEQEQERERERERADAGQKLGVRPAAHQSVEVML
ncbi:hypothetical protein O1L60_41850 [Streptomyces diastatochromogenes]|nr:hypothetical protein [Streptomyces diastatochromogenes]